MWKQEKEGDNADRDSEIIGKIVDLKIVKSPSNAGRGIAVHGGILTLSCCDEMTNLLTFSIIYYCFLLS
jgi:hypothetical protein